jgi:hypothetical protein
MLPGRQSMRRRPAIHFGVFYSTSDKNAIIRDRVIPADGHWIEPVAPTDHGIGLHGETHKSVVLCINLHTLPAFEWGCT